MIQIPDPHITVFDSEAKDPLKLENYTTTAHWDFLDAKRGYKIRISEGCLGNCSYCVAKYATKDLQSRPLEQILADFQEGIQQHYTKFLFTGSDTGAYGQDLGINVVDLLTALLTQDGDYQIYFHDFGINWLIKYQEQLLPLFQTQGVHIGSFIFPIQSGSDSILKAMNRPYRIQAVYDVISKLKSLVPDIKIGTHFIVGFPGESEADFAQTQEIVRLLPFNFVVVFRYSQNPRADSFKFPGKIPAEIIDQRAIELQAIFNQKETQSLL